MQLLRSLTAAAVRAHDGVAGPIARALAATLALAPALSLLFAVSGAVPAYVAVGAMTLLVFIILLAGLLLLRIAQVPDMSTAAAWVLGTFATAMTVYALVACFRMPAAAAFAVYALVVVGWSLVLGKRAARPASFDAAEWAALLLCGAVTIMWCWDVAEAPQVLERSGRLQAWVDFLIHGGVISQLGDVRAAGRGSIDLVDVPAAPYHYASYVLPAIFAQPLDLPGLGGDVDIGSRRG